MQRYLSNKIKHKEYINYKFPDKPVKNDIIEFLENTGFSKVYEEDRLTVGVCLDKFKEFNNKSGVNNLYIVSDVHYENTSICNIFIYTANDNSLFVFTANDTGKIDNNEWLAASYYDDGDRKKSFYEYQEAKEYICKHFDWD